MKKIILFGIGDNGKKMVDTYVECGADFQIVVIADNKAEVKTYRDIPVVHPEKIMGYEFDEIWIASIYYEEIQRQLSEELHIVNYPVRYIEYPMPFLEPRIYEKYKEEIAGRKKCDTGEMQEVVDYIQKKGVRMYNYPFFDEYMEKDVEIFFDSEYSLFYGVYRTHRMYLSRKLNTLQMARTYFRYVCMEQDWRSPHCYLTNETKSEEWKEVVDIGAAEGVFALEIIDTVDHVYLIEADADWCEALALTFRFYKEKVAIIQGYASNTEGKGTIVLDRLLEDKKIDFIKMDIEGAEMQALWGAEKLIDKSGPRMAICTYHNPGDNKMIREWLLERGYGVEDSPGYVVCQGEWELENKKNVDFRRALVKAGREEDEKTGSVHSEL